jgi:endonuclease-3 related protein
MPRLDESFATIMAALAAHCGPLPPMGGAAGLEPFPALVSLLLSQTIGPQKAPRALAALDGAGLLDPHELAGADLAEIADVLRASGVGGPPRRLAPLQRLARWFAGRAQGATDSEALARIATESLRAELASLRGIGPATADALLLLGLGRPVYPVDRASYRILIRHGWLELGAEYDEARAVLEGPCRHDPDALRRLSHGLEAIGREFCRVRAPRCDRCPLRPMLPEGGPIEPEGFFKDEG